MIKTTKVHEAAVNITTLVVDDRRIIQVIHRKLLNNLGIENQVAGNGKEAVEVHCSRKQFDLIPMDITTLVVDDSRIIQVIHRKLLNNLDIENQVAGNGKEAVEVHCSGKQFDLILMDMEMPIMNAIEATRTLPAMGIQSLIAGVSSHCHSEDVREFVEAGLDDYQEKPLTTSKLVTILQKVKNS